MPGVKAPADSRTGHEVAEPLEVVRREGETACYRWSGAEVEEGALVCVIEAMKMENEIAAHRSGKVEELNVAEGDAVSSGDVLAVIK